MVIYFFSRIKLQYKRGGQTFETRQKNRPKRAAKTGGGPPDKPASYEDIIVQIMKGTCVIDGVGQYKFIDDWHWYDGRKKYLNTFCLLENYYCYFVNINTCH